MLQYVTKAIRRRDLLLTACVIALICSPGSVRAAQYPNATCPDSTGMIFRIQSVPAVTCSPALGDTVRGVGGIIIGFDPIATGFDAFIQNTGGGPFSGIDFFTGTINTKAAPYNWAVGDSIIVEYGKTAEFQGLTEILAPNASTSSPNWIARKVSSGNPLPPFFVGTTTQLRETPTNTFAEQYEGGLVKILGPLTVVRNSLTGGMGTNNSFLLISASAPSDSVFVEGNKLTTYAPPAVGTVIQSVQGVLGQATRGYRIYLRNGNDIVADTAPIVTDAYPLTDNIIRIKFDRDVTSTSATNTANYSLASLGSVDAAAMDGSDAVQLTINNGLNHGDLETVTINGVASVASGLAMTSPLSRTFVNGLLTAADIQKANPDSLLGSPCFDKSRFAGSGGQLAAGNTGTRCSAAGTITGRYNLSYYMGDPGNPTRGGVQVFAPPATLTIGNKYRFVGAIQEFFGETEFTSIAIADDLGPGASISPVVANIANAGRDTCDVLNALVDGEDYEGRLVTLRNVKVVQRFPTLPTNGFHVADRSYPDTIFVQNFNNVLTPLAAPALGSVITVTGHIHYDSGSFRLAPRSYADITAGDPSNDPTYSITALTSGHGSVTRIPDLLSYPLDSNVQLTATPDPGFSFIQWTGDTLAAANPLVLTVKRNMNLTAVFDSSAFTISASAGAHGRVSIEPLQNQYARGSLVRVIGLPDPAYRLAYWSGDSASTRDTLSITVTGPTSVHAEFAPDSLAAAKPLAVKDVPSDQGGFATAMWPASRLEVQYPGVTCCYVLQRGSASERNLGWTTIATTPASGAPSYQLTTSTPADSSALTSADFPYRLLTVIQGDTATWSSGIVLGHSTDNIAPPQVASVSGTIVSGVATFFWPTVTANDLAGYRIYRGATVDFPADVPHRIGATTQAGFSDPAGNFNYYKVTSIDIHDNESPATRLITLNATDVDGEPRGIPARLELSAPHPSPSQGDFRVELGLPSTRMVHAEVIDLSGRVIRALHAGELPAGWKALRWDAHDDRGTRSAPGLYFLRVTVAGEGRWTRRLILTQ